MKKLLSVCVLALSFAVNATAQDAKAKAILDNVTKKVNTLKTIKANFALKLTGGKVNDSKKGTIAIKGTKYHVQLTGQEIICDNKTVWTYNADAKEVTVSTFNPKDQSISPAKLLTNFYDKEYRYKYIGERAEGGKKCDVIELMPIDASKPTVRIELLIDKATSMITGGNIWARNGNKTTYMISNVVTDKPIADDFFTWNAKAHPGIEVNDLR